MNKNVILLMALMMGAVTMTSCSSDDDKKDNGGNTDFDLVTTNPIVDQDSYALILQVMTARPSDRVPLMHAEPWKTS